MSAQLYASPGSNGAVVDRLDVMILGAAEVDTDFNVNVTAVGGRIIGGSGGHADTAAGSRLSIVTTRLRSRHGPKIVRKVECLTTPGEHVDVIVTDGGIAVNPTRADLISALEMAGIETFMIEQLREMAGEAGREPPARNDRVVAQQFSREGALIDIIHGLRTA